MTLELKIRQWFLIFCSVWISSACSTVGDVGNARINEEIEYYSINKDEMQGGNFLLGTLRWGVEIPGLREDLNFAFENTSNYRPWLLMLSIETNSKTYKLYHIRELSESGSWEGVFASNEREPHKQALQANREKIENFFRMIRDEGCTDVPQPLIPERTVHFITAHNATGMDSRFAISAPRNEFEDAKSTGDLRSLDGQIIGDYEIRGAQNNRGECFSELSDYVEFLQDAFG